MRPTSPGWLVKLECLITRLLVKLKVLKIIVVVIFTLFKCSILLKWKLADILFTNSLMFSCKNQNQNFLTAIVFIKFQVSYTICWASLHNCSSTPQNSTKSYIISVWRTVVSHFSIQFKWDLGRILDIVHLDLSTWVYIEF